MRILRDEALQVNEERLRMALATAELGMWDLNPVSGDLVWDARCKEIFGLPREAEVDYHTFLAGLHPDDRDRTQEAVDWALDPASGGHYEVEYRTIGLRDGGTTRWVRATGRAFFSDGRPVRFIGIVQDITARRRTEDVLAKQSRLLDLCNDTIFVWDVGGVITYWNKGAVEAYGYNGDEALGKSPQLLLQTEFPEPLPHIYEKLRRDDRWSGELVHARKDGSKITVVSRWALDRDAKGRPVAILETNYDITAQNGLKRDSPPPSWLPKTPTGPRASSWPT